ncbi:hypothetical protein KRP22_004216 [Phytophthora ramorum]|nr:hypothetical protein KRP22_13318 [Phytophthora ramorum]
MAAVEHADYRAWRYLLTQHCGVKLGKYGDELFEATIVVKFSLDVDVKGHVHENGKIDYDSVRFCGTYQRKHPSKEYLKALDWIAALDDNVNPGEPGVEIKIPVKLDLYTKSESIPTSLGEIVDIVGAEKEAQEQ